MPVAVRAAGTPIAPASTDGLPGRVLFVTPRFAPDLGGVETHCLQVGRRLVAAGVPVTLATTDLSGARPRRERIEGIDVHRFPAWPRSLDLYVAPALARFVRAHPWPLVHVQGYHTAVAPLGMLAAAVAGHPYVVNLHSGGHSSRLRSLVRPAQGLALRPLLVRAERVIAGSRFEASTFIRRVGLDPGRVVVIPSGTDLGPLADTAARPGAATAPARKPGLIVSPGRLERYKGHHRVLEALPWILARRPDARLRILGAGPERDDLERRAADLGIADRVEIGPVSGQEAVRAAILEASVVVSLSEYESQGLSVLEAISLGIPVVATRTSAFTELAERGLITPVEPQASGTDVAATVLAILERPPEAGGMPVALPTWDDSASQLLDLYRELARERAGTGGRPES